MEIRYQALVRVRYACADTVGNITKQWNPLFPDFYIEAAKPHVKFAPARSRARPPAHACTNKTHAWRSPLIMPDAMPCDQSSLTLRPCPQASVSRCSQQEQTDQETHCQFFPS